MLPILRGCPLSGLVDSPSSKKVLALWGTGLFLCGVVVGGFWAPRFFAPPTTPPTLPLVATLDEAHRLLDKGLDAEAEKSYLAILARDPANPEALTHLGNVAFGRGDIDLALRYYEASLRQDPSYAHALWDKGNALRGRGDDAGAIQAWEVFAGLFPPDSSDVVQAKKWIAEAKARLSSPSAVLLKPPESLRKPSKRSADNSLRGEAAR